MKEMLEGLKVADFSNNAAGPIAAGMLADHGAEVIKLERPITGDDNRWFAPMIDGHGLYHCWFNRGKKSVVVDLKDPRGVEIAKKVIADSDVLIESFTPGVMEKLGLGYEAVKEIKPDIIYCSVSAFGHKGPYANKPGYDIIAQAFSGIMNITGEADGTPTVIGTTIGDSFGAMNAFSSIMTALYYRTVSGKGQHVDISLARGLIWLNGSIERVNAGIFSKRQGNHNPSLCPYGLFRGKGDQSIIIGAVNPKLWEKLCRTIGREDMIEDPRYEKISIRSGNQKDVIEAIEEWLSHFEDIAEAAALLEKAGIPNFKVYDNRDLVADEHVLENKWLVEVETMTGMESKPTYLCRNVNAEFSDAPGSIKKAPALGEHNFEILQRYGLSREEIEDLQEKWGKK